MYGMAGRGEERRRWAPAPRSPHVHHGHAVAHVPHHAEVMGHEEIGEPELRLEIQHQVEDLRLHRDVEGGHGLVGDHEARVQRERPRDADALALPSAEGVRDSGACTRAGDRPGAGARPRGPCRSSRLPTPLATSGSATMSRSVRRGFSEENGSWKIICIWRRRGRSSLLDRVATSSTAARPRAEEDAARRRGQRAQHAARGRGLAAAALARPAPASRPAPRGRSHRPPRARGRPRGAGSPCGSESASAGSSPRGGGAPLAAIVIAPRPRRESTPRAVRRRRARAPARPGRSAPA